MTRCSACTTPRPDCMGGVIPDIGNRCGALHPTPGTYVPLTEDCPACGAKFDWHPDPSGPNCEMWMVCEACGFMRDHNGRAAA